MRARLPLVLVALVVPACGGDTCDEAFADLLVAAEEVGGVAEPPEPAMTAFFDAVTAAEASCGDRLPELIEENPQLQESLEGG